MTSQDELLIIALTWVVLFVLYSAIRFLLKDRLLTHSTKIYLPNAPAPAKPPGTLFSKIGVLFVFAVNIITIILVLVDALSSSIGQSLMLVKVNLPYWVQGTGSLLFVIGILWGFFAMIFNPTYTPLYKVPPQPFILATQGPYAIIRHPRYAAEAFLNIALFLFTGIWLPLFGLIGWIAIYHQARAEENYLMAVAAKEYGEYRKKTRMFF
jgi:protein-S-isoprenylcysteine O-methyltransferase Ste14